MSPDNLTIPLDPLDVWMELTPGRDSYPLPEFFILIVSIGPEAVLDFVI
jgi:hypothetical protein